MRQELPADAGALLCRGDIGMADKIHLAHVLQSHNPDEAAAILITPEHDAGLRLVPAVGRDRAAISHGGGIDDGENVVALNRRDTGE
jgi:hypothetical protein